MIINKLILKNFRIFKGTHEFDFSKSKIIVIDGPNGHGKSTIFDAINWVMSGRINRYTGSSEYQKFNYIMNNNVYRFKEDYTSVELELGDGHEIINIKRIMKNNGTVELFINGTESKLKEGQLRILELIIYGSKREQQKNYIDLTTLLSSSTILSQENLEDFVRSDKPTDRYNKLEKILGLTKYGEEFRDYLNKLKKKLEENKADYINISKDLEHQKDIFNTEYIEKIKFENKINFNDEKSLIKDIQETFAQVNAKYFESLPVTNHISEQDLLIIKRIRKENHEVIGVLNEVYESIKRNKLIGVQEIHIKNLLNKLISEKDLLERKRVNRINGLKKAKSKKDNLSFMIKIKQNIKELNLKIEETESRKQNVRNELLKNYRIEDLKDLATFQETFEEWEKLHVQINQQMFLNTKKREKLKIDKKKQHTDDELELLKNKLIPLRAEINRLNISINNLLYKQTSRKDSYVNKLVNEIQEIILTSNNEQSCIVCGTNFVDEQELKMSVNRQLQLSFDDLGKLEKETRDLELEKTKIVIQIEELENKIRVLEQGSYKLKSSILKINDEISSAISIIDSNINKLDQYSLNKKSDEIFSLISTYRIKYNFAKEYKKIEEQQLDLFMKKDLLDKSINEALSNNLSRVEQFDVASTKGRLFCLENYIHSAESHKKILIEEIINKQETILKEENRKKCFVENKVKLQKILSMEKIQLDDYILSELAIDKIEVYKNNETKLKRLNEIVVSYINSFELSTLEMKLNSKKGEIRHNKNIIDRHQFISNQLGRFINNHRAVQSQLVNEYLGELTDEVNKFYRQISPHAYYQYLRMLVKDNELFILVSENENDDKKDEEILLKECVNASLTFSAAQSTVLAMSIFLALNVSQNDTRLNILAIDDPFQNLDDINIYSFIDVLSFLVTEERKQIFISTHHEDFSKLIDAKLSTEKSEITHVTFQSYTSDSIEVRSNCYKQLIEN